MSTILFILSLVVGWIIFQKYRSLFGVVYFDGKLMAFEYIICCTVAFLVLALLCALLVVILKSLVIGIIIAGITFLVIFALEKFLGEKMLFGIRDRAVHYGLIAVCLISAIGYFIYFFNSDGEDSGNQAITECITQEPISNIITINSI